MTEVLYKRAQTTASIWEQDEEQEVQDEEQEVQKEIAVDSEDVNEQEFDEGFFLGAEIEDEIVPEIRSYGHLLSKVRAIVKFFKYDLKNEFLQNKIKEINERNGNPAMPVKLTLDVRTRWNSLISMLDAFLKVNTR